ncbi:MAG: DUF4339 domain-containing protein [Phycisphaerales bacterium]|nr:DUF4339 domain-containing protein [Phycisphaerales bacterium]
MNYRFVINREASQPYDESGIRKLIELNLVGPDTPAWREGMAAWEPAGRIPELANLWPAATANTPASVPPPIPDEPVNTAAAPPNVEAAKPSGEVPAVPPPPIVTPSAAAPGTPPPLPTAGDNGLQHYTQRFVYYFFRTWNGRPSKVRAYVEADPRRAVPVAAAVLVIFFFLFVLAVAPFVPDDNGPEPAPGGHQAMPASPPPGVSMEQWRIMRDAQRQTDNILEDSYRYNRDSFDRQSETYRRGTYDWYTDKD